MERRLRLLLVCGALAAASAVRAQTLEDRRVACASAAFERYTTANVALLTSQSAMTPEALLQQRRLQEAYCAYFARCSVIGIDPNSAAIPYFAAFASCLKDEAKASLGDDDE